MKFYRSIFIFIILIFFGACSSKTTTYLNAITILGAKPEPKISNVPLEQIAKKIQNDTNASLVILTKANQDTSNEVNLFLTNKYLKISFALPNMFPRTYTNLSKETIHTIEKIIPVLKAHPQIIIQIIGHAYDEGTQKEMQHYADLRAISVAELLYDSGLKQDVLAKGCSNFIPRQHCNPNKPHILCNMKNRRIDIFIYTSKEDVITKCR